MHCNDVTAILDTHRHSRLSAAERTTVDAHLATCGDCAAAWHAQTELLALRMPRVPATLLERAVLAARVPPVAPARRAWPPLAIGAALVAGAALAGVTIVSLTRSPSVELPSSAGGEPSARVDAADEVAAPPAAAPAAVPNEPPADTTTSVELVETALSIIPIVRRGPEYPADALQQGLSGHVQVKFDVSAAGVVENASVVESSDAVFEDSALRAVATWRYLPRIAAGKRVGSTGIHTILRFVAPDPEQSPADQPQSDATRAAAQREYLAFAEGLEVALERLAADDMRGAELQLDEMQAIYGADRGDLWSFYGYLFTAQGNYDRAIDSYEQSLAAFAKVGTPASGPWVPLANLYFARHQYDVALQKLVEYRDAVTQVQAANPGRPARPLDGEAARLVEQLRALGVDVDALAGR